MNRLEQYICDNKSQFEEEPAAGHFERLQQKINRKSGKIILLRWGISIAASIIILFSIGIFWQNTGKQDNILAMCENSSDMKICYLDKMNALATQIELLSESLDQWDQQQVMIDVQNIIDIADSDFESEIPKELPAKEAKLILSDYYRQNLESLEMIAEELRIRN
jgi:hypothetical protein